MANPQIMMLPELSEELMHLQEVTGAKPDQVQRALVKQVKKLRADASTAAATRVSKQLERLNGR